MIRYEDLLSDPYTEICRIRKALHLPIYPKIVDEDLYMVNGVQTNSEFTRRDYYMNEEWKKELIGANYKEINSQIIPGTFPEYETINP
jgi:hypothetical protein